MKLTAYQKKALNMLLDKYEGSKTYTGQNKVNQTFSVTPDQVYPEYYSNYASIDQVHAFEDQMKALADRILLLKWKRESLYKIFLTNDPEGIEAAYALLGRNSRSNILAEEETFFREKLGQSEITDRYCLDMLERIARGKKLSDRLEDEAALLKLLGHIIHNQEDILERELSISVLGDSKAFEKSWRPRVCRILEKYGGHEERLSGIDNTRERQIALLEEYGVYTNPSYVYMKGNGDLTFSDGTVYDLQADKPVAFSSQTIRKISSLAIRDENLMTVENLTSFNRIQKENVFSLYLAGYHNTLKQKLLMKIASGNRLDFYHFGDIDPDGFLILEHLKRETGIPFRPYRMGLAELQKYREYCRPLEANDIRKAENLLKEGRYEEEMRYMLDHNCKLEQEIISWEERAGSNRNVDRE